jgi:hypothetical protein
MTTLTGADFVYKGMFKVPQWAFAPGSTTLQGNRTSYNYSDSWESPLAMRIVNGQVRFFVLCNYTQGGAVIEIALPTSLSQTVSAAVTASTVDFWGTTVYGSPTKKVSAQYPSGNSSAVLTTGLLWDEARQILWWSAHDVFDNIGVGPTLGYAKLTTPTGSPTSLAQATSYGPFDVGSATNDTHNVNGNLMLLPSALQSPAGNRRLAIGGVFSSILGRQQFGPNMMAFDEPQDNSTPTTPGTYPWGPGNRFIAGTKELLKFGRGTPAAGNNYLKYCHRPNDYTVMGLTNATSPPQGGAGGTDVMPVGSTGYWTNRDRVSGAVYIQTANKEGLVFTGGSSSGMNWYSEFGYNGTQTSGAKIGNDPRGYSGWYNGTFNGGRVGCDDYRPAFYIFSQQNLLDGANGQYPLDPAVVRQPVGPLTGTVFNNAKMSNGIGYGSFGGCTYDPTTQRLYVLQNYQYIWAGLETFPVIHVFEVQDTGGGGGGTGTVPSIPTHLNILFSATIGLLATSVTLGMSAQQSHKGWTPGPTTAVQATAEALSVGSADGTTARPQVVNEVAAAPSVDEDLEV